MTTVIGFSMPEYDSNGNLVSEVVGDSADITPDGQALVRNLSYTRYKDGEKVLSVTSPECVCNEEEKNVNSEQDVRVVYGDNMIVTGKGFACDLENERLVIHSQVKVVLKNAKKNVKVGE